MHLNGIQILDLADQKASFCTKLLADLGARVIKIERLGGNPSRHIGPFARKPPHPEASLSFCYNNTNKLGITLNLACSEGKDLFCRLAEQTVLWSKAFHQSTCMRWAWVIPLCLKLIPA